MRDIRIGTSAILAIGLLAASGVGVSAQDHEGAAPGPEAASLVSGELIRATEPDMDCGRVQFDSVDRTSGHTRERGRVCGATAEMSDPRLSGEVTFMDDADRYGVGADFSDIVWGDITIVNDEGTWEGRSVGTSDVTKGGEGIDFFELVGSGAYEGLSAILFHLEADDDLLTGVIFPGELSEDR